MSIFSVEYLSELLRHYGYGLVGVVVGLEATGLPLPGESIVIAAALYAGTTHQLSIVWVVVAAAAGAIIGDNVGYLVGRGIGLPLMRRYGHYVFLTPERLAMGERLFARHGGKVVLFGRFLAILRTLAALMAGATRMEWRRFLMANGIGGVLWSSTYGFGAYALGNEVKRLQGPIGIAFGVVAAVVVVAVVIYSRRQERRLTELNRAPPD